MIARSSAQANAQLIDATKAGIIALIESCTDYALLDLIFQLLKKSA